MKIVRMLLCGHLALPLTGCGRSMVDLKSLAANGSIDTTAPVLTHVQADVNAPAERVWAILVDLPFWPMWQSGIESVSGGRLAPGSSFDWTTGGTKIHSEVQLFDLVHRLSWTGKAYTAKAVHVWTLTALSPGRTRVNVDESMEGPLMAKLFSSRQLQQADSEWVDALKRQAERN